MPSRRAFVSTISCAVLGLLLFGDAAFAATPADALKTKHAFKTEMDDEAKRAMFPQNERLKK